MEDESIITFAFELAAGFLVLAIDISVWFIVGTILLIIGIVVWFFDEEAAMEIWEHIGDD